MPTTTTTTTITDEELESLEAMLADTTPGLQAARSAVSLGVVPELLAEVRAARQLNAKRQAAADAGFRPTADEYRCAAHAQRRTTVLTYSGKMVDLYQPDPDTIDFADIAMALGRLNRYNGHTTRPYTVAEHSIRMSYLVPEEDAVWALVHDAAEAYIGDIISPVKRLCPELYVMERALLDVICDKLGLPRDMPASVLEADERLLATEARMFLTGDISWAKAEPYPSDNHYAWAPHLGGGLGMFPDAFWMARLSFLLPDLNLVGVE